MDEGFWFSLVIWLSVNRIFFLVFQTDRQERLQIWERPLCSGKTLFPLCLFDTFPYIFIWLSTTQWASCVFTWSGRGRAEMHCRAVSLRGLLRPWLVTSPTDTGNWRETRWEPLLSDPTPLLLILEFFTGNYHHHNIPSVYLHRKKRAILVFPFRKWRERLKGLEVSGVSSARQCCCRRVDQLTPALGLVGHIFFVPLEGCFTFHNSPWKLLFTFLNRGHHWRGPRCTFQALKQYTHTEHVWVPSSRLKNFWSWEQMRERAGM